jgi:hypothetical protein
MRILSIAHNLANPAAKSPVTRSLERKLTRKPARDRSIIGRGSGEGECGQLLPQGERNTTIMLSQRLKHPLIIGRIGHRSHIGVVLGRRPNHRRASDIDVFHGCRGIGAARHGFLERIQVDRRQVDFSKAVAFHGCPMIRVVANPEKAPMHARMQSLDASIHDLGKTGQFGDITDRKTFLFQSQTGSAGGNQFHPRIDKAARKSDKAALVGNREQRAADAHQIRSGMVFGNNGHGYSSSKPPAVLRRSGLRYHMAVRD